MENIRARMKMLYTHRAPEKHRDYSERSGARQLSSLMQFGAYRNQASRRRSAAFTVTIIMIGLLLTACGVVYTPTPIPTVVLDNNTLTSNNQASDENSISASAVIVPINDAQLSFTTVGKVTQVNVKVGDQVSAGDVLVQLDTTILDAKVKEAEANVIAAQAQINYLNRLNTDTLHLESAQAELVRAQALLDSAKATLASQSTLTSPFAGTIVSVDISPAETVTPGKTVILLGDLSQYQIETTDLSERDVPRVQAGQPVSIFIEALSQEITGEVVSVSQISSTLGGDVVYPVTIKLGEQPDGLRWGMSADVAIEIGE